MPGIDDQIAIVEEQEDFLLINKPAGISTHSSPGDTSPNVIALLEEKYYQLYPVMRLDRMTSGLLVIGKTAEFAAGVKFNKKLYQAVVLGQVQGAGTIDKSLTVKKFATREKQKQSAHTEYRVIKQWAGFSWLELEITTGRHHQIRKHLRSIGHPVLGDFRHGYKDKNLEFQAKLQGQELSLMLHCSQLSFKWLGKEYSYKVDWPVERALIFDFLDVVE